MSDVENYWDYTFYTDDQGRNWVKYIEGEGDTIRIPNGVYGLSKDTLLLSPQVDKVLIPACVQEIEKDVFARYADNLTIYCEAESEPEGWYREEFEKYLPDNTDPNYFKKEVHCWLGRYQYTSEDTVTDRGAFSPHVVWGSDLFKK